MEKRPVTTSGIPAPAAITTPAPVTTSGIPTPIATTTPAPVTTSGIPTPVTTTTPVTAEERNLAEIELQSLLDPSMPDAPAQLEIAERGNLQPGIVPPDAASHSFAPPTLPPGTESVVDQATPATQPTQNNPGILQNLFDKVNSVFGKREELPREPFLNASPSRPSPSMFGADRGRNMGKTYKVEPAKMGKIPQSTTINTFNGPVEANDDEFVVVPSIDDPSLPARESLATKIYNYLKNTGRGISFKTVKDLVGRHKTSILIAIGIAAAAAIIYGAYKLYHYVKGTKVTPVSPAVAPTVIPPQIVGSTIKEVLDALAAEFPWIRANIGTARSILVNGFEAGKFEAAVDHLIEEAARHAGSGLRGKKRRHRGAGVMMV